MSTTLKSYDRVDGVMTQARMTAKACFNMEPSEEQWQRARQDLIAGKALLLAKPPLEPGAKPFQIHMVNIGNVPLTVGWNPVEKVIVSVMKHRGASRGQGQKAPVKGKRS